MYRTRMLTLLLTALVLCIADVAQGQAGPPDLILGKNPVGTFFQGQVGATYSIRVSNIGGSTTTGFTIVTDNLPAGLTPTGATGTGFTCGLVGIHFLTVTCTSIQAVAPGNSFPDITLFVNVADNAPANVTNCATVAGGGETKLPLDIGCAVTSIEGRPDLAIFKQHTDPFFQGQAGAFYTITVDNVGGAATTGPVTVTDSLPAGLTATAIAAPPGWICTPIDPAIGISGPATLTCTTSDPLPAAAHVLITLTVNVADNAPTGGVTNTATVSGGENEGVGPGIETDPDTANDPTRIIGVPDVTITKTHIGNFSQGQVGATYTITVKNIGGAPTTPTTTVTDTLPAGLTPTNATSTDFTCVIAAQTVTCTSTAAVPPNGTFVPITLTVNVANNAPPTLTNCATVSGGGENEGVGPGIETDPDTACDPTNIFQVNDTLLINYFAGANGSRPDQTVRITNPGTSTDPSGTTTSDLCANIYVFRNDQQLAECCSCLVTPNGLRTLSVDFDLTHNPLTAGAVGEGVIKIVPSSASRGCSPAVAASSYLPLPALRAWGVHNQDVSGGGLQGTGVINAVTETEFLGPALSPAELRGLQNNCAFITNLGSKSGICLCGRGD